MSARHPSLPISDFQEMNLRILSAHLRALPPEYPDFAMDRFISNEPPAFGQGGGTAKKAECGTAACAAGHGPIAGITPLPGENWMDYSERCFCPGSEDDDDGNLMGAPANFTWAWCFDGEWSHYDNSAHGAAARSDYMLHHGVPHEFHAEDVGDTEPDVYSAYLPASDLGATFGSAVMA